MGTKEKRLCEYGAKCYRKNPQHFEKYSHPDRTDETVFKNNPKETDGKNDVKRSTGSSSDKKMKQTTLSFPKKCEYSSAPKTQTSEEQKKKKEPSLASPKSKTPTHSVALKRKRKHSNSEKIKPKIVFKNNDIKATSFINDINCESIESAEGFNSDSEGVESAFCESAKNQSNEIGHSSDLSLLKDKTKEDIIKSLFLVDMPADFYSFYEFCKSVNESHPFKALEICDLKLTGPFDVLSGRMDYSVDKESFLCHWRFYYDPPEFQTVLVTESGFHIGYWRDEPNKNPVFLASNNSDKDHVFKIEAENIFGTVFHYLNKFIRSCDPFKKVKMMNLQKALSGWAEKNKFPLETTTSEMKERQKKVVSKTFHGAGIVVPVQPESGVGYRPLIETDGNLKRICKLIMQASDEEEKESLWENLEPLISAANIANDECDFGNSLELGIDLFCMGSPIFHSTVEHLLSTAYSLLNRPEFDEIIRAHLKLRRKGVKMAPKPYSDKSSLPNDCANDVLSEVSTQLLPETLSPQSLSASTTPSPTPHEEVTIEPLVDNVVLQETSRVPDFVGLTPCYPTPGDIMPYDHSLPDFIRQITNQPNLANLQALSLRVISTLISLHRMSSYLPNLRELDLEGSVLNSLRDIGCSLKNLEILKVGRCQLESLDGTFGLSSLKELYAQKNFINDVSPCSNLPHIRHIDVSGNRIRNISYAGFLSVCSKLRSIVFTENPATQVPDYRKHVRRILPQLEILDGISIANEDEPRPAENCYEESDSSSTGIPDFSSVSPSDSLNNFFDSEEDFSVLDKKNKHAKNLASQDQADDAEHEAQQASPDGAISFEGSSPHTKVKSGLLEQAKILENRSMSSKQKCTSMQKLDKDMENRSKKSNFLLNGNLGEDCACSPTTEEENPALPSTSSSLTHNEDSRQIHPKERETTKASTSRGLSGGPFGDVRAEEVKLGAIKRRSAVPKSPGSELSLGTSKLSSGLPVCGNLTAALRNRKRIQSSWNGKEKSFGETEEGDRVGVRLDGSGDDFGIDSTEKGCSEKPFWSCLRNGESFFAADLENDGIAKKTNPKE